jgi:hypothetical protein
MANGNGTGLTEDDFLNLVSDQFPNIIGNVESGVRNVFGKPGLSPEEEDRLTRLNQRANRLQPIDIPGPQGSTRIAGNPYSYDVSPAIQGGQNVIEGIMNAVRQKKLQGDPDQLKKSRQKINAAQEELKKLERDSLKDMNMLGPDSPDDLTQAVSGDKKRRMQQLRSQIEQETKKLRDARGVQGQRANLLEKKEEAQKADQTIEELVANISPRVAQTMFDRQETAEQQERAHDLTLEEIETRHEATMDEIRARNQGEGGSSALPAAVLDTLSENVGAVQTKIQGDVDSLRTEKLRLQRAKNDEDLRETMEERLGEDQTIDDRINEIETEISNKNQRLQRSVNQMIEVSASRNNLDRATTARLLGLDPEEYGLTGGQGDNGNENDGTGGEGAEDGGATVSRTRDEVRQWADKYMDGDFEKAKQWLKENRNVVIEN